MLSKSIALIYSCFVLFFIGCDIDTPVSPWDLRCEYRVDPLGIDNVHPRLSWKMDRALSERGQRQTSYRILIASSMENLNEDIGDLWDTGRVSSDQSVNNTYNGQALSSAQECYWKVKVWDMENKASQWSKTAKFTIGLLAPSDWTGEWIHKEDQKKTDHNWYRKSFTLSEEVKSAYVYLGSFGYHELYVNGQKATENVMNPVSSYMKARIPYLTYDIADLLQTGDNVIAVWHAAGWARWDRIEEYRNPPFVFKAQVNIKTVSSEISLATDTSWKCKKSHSEYYGDWDILDFGGETIDDRLREDDWHSASYDDSSWSQASIYDPDRLNAQRDIEGPITIKEDIPIGPDKFKNRKYSEITATLSAQMVEPQVKYRQLKAIDVKDNGDGTYRIDMGENYTGFFEMNLYNGSEGDSVIFEISDQTEKIMNWHQRSKYIYGASGEGIFANRFNIAGGRWITVYGLDYEPSLDDIKGYVITNDRRQISSFECSSEQLNQIYEVNLKTYLANTLDGILMDCPHRERRGWGEVTVAAIYGDALPNFESGAYMDQYLQYTRDAQLTDGQIRAVINEQDRPFLMWKANNPITVWETYKVLGDQKVLEDNYSSMVRWMDWLYEHSYSDQGGPLKAGDRGARAFPGLGDWCTPRGNFWTSSNSPSALHFNNCIYAFMLDNAVKVATALGREEDAIVYAERLSIQRKATHEMSYNPQTGQYVDGKQVDQAFALLAGVTPEEEREKVYRQLVDNVLYRYPYYDTGSSGQGLYTRYFTEYGERMDLIYELLRDRHHPSYGYFLEQGKTVWPERWSAVGVSQIHTCYTGIGGYFVKGFGGIRPGQDGVGMQHMTIKPAPVGDLTYANTSHESMYGSVIVNWEIIGDKATYHIEVPPNTTAKLYLPAMRLTSISEGDVSATEAIGVSYVGTEKSEAVGQYVIFDILSGTYDFTVHEIPSTDFPDPLSELDNLALLGRISASSMYIETEKLPGYEAFKANDENSETRWLSADTDDQYIEIAWIKPQTFNRLMIDEYDEQISSYRLQYWDGAEWVDIYSGTSCGAQREHQFDSVTAEKVRVYIEESISPPSIKEISVSNV